MKRYFAVLLIALAPTLCAQVAVSAVAAPRDQVLVRSHAPVLRHIGGTTTRYVATVSAAAPASSARVPTTTRRIPSMRMLQLRR